MLADPFVEHEGDVDEDGLAGLIVGQGLDAVEQLLGRGSCASRVTISDWLHSALQSFIGTWCARDSG